MRGMSCGGALARAARRVGCDEGGGEIVNGVGVNADFGSVNFLDIRRCRAITLRNQSIPSARRTLYEICRIYPSCPLISGLLLLVPMLFLFSTFCYFLVFSKITSATGRRTFPKLLFSSLNLWRIIGSTSFHQEPLLQKVFPVDIAVSLS